MGMQYEVLSCPFCHENTISCYYFPSATKLKIRSTATFGRSVKRIKSAETWVIRAGCSNCNKSLEEVEKKLRDDGTI